MSTNDWKFGHGRLSNASIESYFRTVKASVLEKATKLRPTDFLMRNYKHTISRFKGDKFGVAQSSHGRKKAQGEVHDLNVKEPWQRRPKQKTKDNRRAHHFNEKVSQTTACKISYVFFIILTNF